MKKKRNLKKTVSGLMPFIKPYKWNFVNCNFNDPGF